MLECKHAYYLKNREAFIAKSKQYKKDHPEKSRAWAKAYAAKHPEMVLAKRKRYEKLHPDRTKAKDRRWAEQNPEKVRARNDRRRARLAGVLHTLTARQWDAILAFYENRCAYCGRGDVPMTRDHVTPIIQGGGHTADNVVPACLSCNSKKGAKTPEEWRN
jgi:5-methylcytosine-specific restriction endonuclease McrA